MVNVKFSLVTEVWLLFKMKKPLNWQILLQITWQWQWQPRSPLGGHALVFRCIYNMEHINTEHFSQLVWKHCKIFYYRFGHSSSVKRTDNHFSTPLETLTSRLKLPNWFQDQTPSPKNERQATESSKSQKDTGFLLPGKRKGRKRQRWNFKF